jgi:hypothetical protein
LPQAGGESRDPLQHRVDQPVDLAERRDGRIDLFTTGNVT